MSKPLKETFTARIWRLFVGVVFYNTVYWKRASDGLQPPKMTPAQRRESRPLRDLNKIRPRAHPRARLDAQESATVDISVPRLSEAPTKPLPAVLPPPSIEEPSQGERRKKKKRRKEIRLRSEGFFSRWFG